LTDSFHAADGTEISSLPQLSTTLANMTDEIYARHVSDGKNDFADWVKAQGNEDLASELRQAHDRQQAAEATMKAIAREKEQSPDKLRKAYLYHYDEFKRKVSQLRKKGCDMGQCDLILMMIPAKIQLFAATGETRDSVKLMHLFYSLEKEIKEASGGTL